jgi:hypothetical protein
MPFVKCIFIDCDYKRKEVEKGWEETRTRGKKKKRNRRKQQQRRNPASDNCFYFLSRVQNETPSHYVRFDLL